MGSWPLPEFLKEFMSSNGKLAVVAVDLFIISLPVFLTFVVITNTLCRVLGKVNVYLLVVFLIGWFVPAMFIYFQEPIPSELIREWPHVLVVQFMPVFGAIAGYLLLRKKSI